MEAFTRFFERPDHFKFPKFKKKGKCENSFTIPVVNNKIYGPDIYIQNNELLFPKLRVPALKVGYIHKYHCYVSEQPRFSSPPKYATFLEEAGRWYVIFQHEINSDDYEKTTSDEMCGIDLGVRRFATIVTNKGQRLGQNHSKKLVPLLSKIQHIQSKMDRSLHVNNGVKTKSYERLHKKFRSLWKRYRNIKMDTLHKFTYKLTHKFSMIAIEDLDVEEMKKKNFRSLSRQVSNQSFGTFRELLTYKCKLYGVNLVVVDRFFPSSQLCFHCGNRQPMPLKNKVYDCPQCHKKMDRDVNAAANLLKEAIRITQG